MIFFRIVLKFRNLLARHLRYYGIDVSLQNSLYRKVGLDRDKGLQRLNNILTEEFSLKYDENNGMFSEHLVLFSSISIAIPQISNILEIGTYDGRTALILSRLFPNANILTLDLPEDETAFSETYNRASAVRQFLSDRNDLLSKAKNVEYRPQNSLNLTHSSEKFDLIWVDGAHGYPYIACDVVNAARLLNPAGILMVDDIWTKISHSDAHYRSIGGYETIVSLNKAGVLNRFTLFHKRLNGVFNYPGVQKFVAFIQNPQHV